MIPPPPDAEGSDRLRRRLELSRNKLKSVFDSLGEAVVSLTPEGRVESINLSAARLTGRHPRDLVGLEVREFLELARVPAGMRRACQETFQRMLEEGRNQSQVVEAPGRAGSFFYEILASPSLGQGDEVSLGILQLRDVTAYKRMEQTIREYSLSLEDKVAQRTRELSLAHEELKKEKESLAQANERLRRLEQLRHDLTNMVVHDMKGPLAEVMGNLDLLTYEPLSQTQQEYCDLALIGAEDLFRMIMNLLDVDRLEEGRLQVKREELSFSRLAGSVRDKFKTLIKLKELTVELEAPAGDGLTGDPDLLARVLQNLLTNALNHTPEGGRITIKAEPGPEGGVVLSVADTGSGIPKASHGVIFQKFGQAGPGPKTSTGLGLSFCKMAVEAHGGRIWFESEEGQGARFFFWLPGKRAEG